MNNATAVILILVFIFVGGYYYFTNQSQEMQEDTEIFDSSEEVADSNTSGGHKPAALPTNTIVGAWQSIDDSNFVRTIYETGIYADIYEGAPESSTAGSWMTFTKADAPSELPYPLEDDTTYLKMTGETTLYFKVVSVSQKGLVLIYLNRGNILDFVRAK